jgi:hypothetical protein
MNTSLIPSRIALTPEQVRAMTSRFFSAQEKPAARVVKLLHSRFDWAGVDWSRPNTEIAQALGCSVSLVLLYRRALKHAPSGSHGGPQHRFAWTSVDWQQTDTQIARRLGCSASAVWKKRRVNFKKVKS